MSESYVPKKEHNHPVEISEKTTVSSIKQGRKTQGSPPKVSIVSPLSNYRKRGVTLSQVEGLDAPANTLAMLKSHEKLYAEGAIRGQSLGNVSNNNSLSLSSKTSYDPDIHTDLSNRLRTVKQKIHSELEMYLESLRR